MEKGSGMVSASLFAAWWERLVALADERPDDDGLYNLVRTLYEVGLRSRATEPVLLSVGRSPENPLGVFRWEWRLAPGFDWVAGEIDFSGLLVDAETLIETLVRTTGVKEYTDDGCTPAVERLQEGD